MNRMITTAVAAGSILAFGAVSADACPKHRVHKKGVHTKARQVQQPLYTAEYSYSQPVAYDYGYTSQPSGYYHSGWDNNWSGNYTGTFGVNTGFGYIGF